jgi:hypothetical protein
MRLLHTTAWATTLPALCGPAPAADTPKNDVLNELPRSWDIAEIAKAAPPCGGEGRVYFLAWQVRQDGRPMRVESCLALKSASTAGTRCPISTGTPMRPSPSGNCR